LVTQRDEYRSLYLAYLKYCNEHDFDRMASFYTPTIRVNDVPMDPVAVTAQFALLISAFPDWHWEMRHLVVDGDYIAVHFEVTGTHRGYPADVGCQVPVSAWYLSAQASGATPQIGG
jgi:predicted ester cyclase